LFYVLLACCRRYHEHYWWLLLTVAAWVLGGCWHVLRCITLTVFLALLSRSCSSLDRGFCDSARLSG
jgi:hypothetical protein